MTVSLALGDLETAMEFAEILCEVYSKLYPANHPLIAIQWYTLGDLQYRVPGMRKRCLGTLEKAKKILLATRGRDDAFFVGLEEFIASIV